MTRRELYRLKKRIKAHLKRAAVILALLLAVILMICGCLYIGEHLFQSDKNTESNKDLSNDNEAGTSENQGGEADPSNQVLDTDAQITEKYNYTYSKPDASGLSICLDAGHGGNDVGTQSATILEKDINLSVTQKVAALLEEAGASVSLVRDSDEYVDLADRTTFGNQTGADLYISLHCNYYEADSSINGLEIYYHRNSETSKQYAETMTQLLRGIRDMDVRDSSQENMQVLRNSSIPAIMIEMGFLSNSEDCAALNDPLFQEYFARMLVESIVDVLKPSTTGS